VVVLVVKANPVRVTTESREELTVIDELLHA
jgi:hypothetical protein